MDNPEFTCSKGHTMMGWGPDGEPIDFSGYACPLCLGKVRAHDCSPWRIVFEVQASANVNDEWPDAILLTKIE